VLWHDKQTNDRKRLEIVVHEEQVRIIAGSQTLALRLECAVDDSRAEFALLTLKFELFTAGGAKEIRKRAVIGK
jgi:hypothetical protein